jgi:hydroxymethylpyrimidine pyrophosphatase-like HAD family hydrolase
MLGVFFISFPRSFETRNVNTNNHKQTAIAGMLEVLPLGASKGVGVKWLLDRLRIDPSVCMALGDGENDVQMLSMVGLGVAVGNAGPAAREAADVVLEATNDEDAVAHAIAEYVLKPRGLTLGMDGALEEAERSLA